MSNPLARLREMREKSRRNNGTHESRLDQARAKKRYSVALHKLDTALLDLWEAAEASEHRKWCACKRAYLHAQSPVLGNSCALCDAIDALRARAGEVV
jgi:hypothetical protein